MYVSSSLCRYEVIIQFRLQQKRRRSRVRNRKRGSTEVEPFPAGRHRVYAGAIGDDERHAARRGFRCAGVVTSFRESLNTFHAFFFYFTSLHYYLFLFVQSRPALRSTLLSHTVTLDVPVRG
jgi:hypothetical protein